MKRGDLQSYGLPPEEKPSGNSEPRPSYHSDAGPELDLDAEDELKIIDATLEGDADAFSSLFERYRPDLYGFCLRRLDDPSEAEDVVQEIFIRALKNLVNFDRSKRIWPWLATIALRLCTDIHRERSRTYYSGDIGVTLDAGVKGPDSLLDSLIASEDRAQLMKSLKALPKRQRRALELYALENLSYEDIAAAEGISVGAVKLLLVRARRKMRSEHRNGTFGLVAFPFTWLSWKFQRIEERIRPLLGYGEGLSSICAQAVCLSTLAMVVMVTSLPNKPLDGQGSTPSGKTVLLSTQSPLLQTSSPPNALSKTGTSTEAPVEPQQSFADPASFLADQLINPNQSATPETSGIYTIAVSTNYERDHMILASGHSLERHVLFVSPDGGASWKPQVSRLPLGIQYDTVYSPDYLRDRRVFTVGELGFLQSDDGGEIFKPVSGNLFGWSLAISPSFGREDLKILMGWKDPVEYDAGTGVFKPVSLGIPPGTYSFVTFSPGYPSDLNVFVSDDQTTLYRCKGAVCDEVQFPRPGPLKLRFSPRFDQDGQAFAFTGKKLLVSNDGARAFRDLQFPLPDSGYIYDVAVSWSTPSPAIFVSTEVSPYGFIPGPSIHRSFDGGYSWDGTRIHIPGFGYGAKRLIVTPTGRLLATGSDYGIACSVNGGQTWAPRCPPE